VKYNFKDPTLLDVALTHTSWAYENGGQHNERLEFLGDAVLQLASTELLYEYFPDDREGVLHGYRTQLVSTGHLAAIARRWGLGERVKLGKGEESTGGRQKDRLLAGLFEAVLGAVYLDGGYASAAEIIRECLADDVKTLGENEDPRLLLHEWAQKTDGKPPEYVVLEENGPPHNRMFTIEIRTSEGPIGTGRGRSKKAASIEAAAAAVSGLSIKR